MYLWLVRTIQELSNLFHNSSSLFVLCIIIQRCYRQTWRLNLPPKLRTNSSSLLIRFVRKFYSRKIYIFIFEEEESCLDAFANWKSSTSGVGNKIEMDDYWVSLLGSYASVISWPSAPPPPFPAKWIFHPWNNWWRLKGFPCDRM